MHIMYYVAVYKCMHANNYADNLSTTFMISSTTITLSPNETSALVSATIIDDPYPEDQLTYHIHLSSDHGNQTINITILDNDCEYILRK